MVTYIKVFKKKIRDTTGFAVVERDKETGKTLRKFGVFHSLEQANHQVKAIEAEMKKKLIP